ncbi:MAG: IS4 family transposase [Gammaproteobacteria bacterium]|nr:IS4 family transposase [Gammaproteobacteria bacterium]
MCRKLNSVEYINKHKYNSTAFVRERKLNFITVFILILRNSVKSLQLMLNEFMLETKQCYTITAGAFTKARKKLKHTAYVELNADIVDLYYRDDDIERFRGYRILAFDGSKITLPQSEDVKNEFGSKPIANQADAALGEYSRASYQACYDVLNNIAVSSILGHGSSYEVDQAVEMIYALKSDDLLLYDRGYASYYFMATLLANKKNFIIRCPKISFKEVQAVFDDDTATSRIVTINCPIRQKKRAEENKLSKTIKIRLIRLVLSSGEVEVLATSLLNEEEFTVEDFNYLYSLRWGVETFFSKIKGRLALENFTGKTVESIYQDFWSTIFISNLETIMTEDIEKKINESKPIENKKIKINKAVSFNAIKHKALELFVVETDKKIVLDKLMQLFMLNTIVTRENRKAPRKKTSDTQSMNFQKRKRKHVF